MRVAADGETVLRFLIPVDPGSSAVIAPTDWFAAMDISALQGKTLTVEGDLTADFLNSVCVSDYMGRPQGRRPMAHFTPLYGWMNDPNGLYFDGEVFHIHYQHNLFGKRWNNMSWGHAVSEDLLDFTVLPDALYPDRDGPMFSGSALVDHRNTLGLGAGTPLFFYTNIGGKREDGTAAESEQCIAADRGNSFLYEKEGAAVPMIERGNRDPKVYADKDGYFMVLFLSGNDFAVLRSADLRHWETTQRLTLPGLRECPDLVEIPVEGTDEKVWTFFAADGFYHTGRFDGRVFTPDGPRGEMFPTALPYAAQTFSGTDGVILMSWYRSKDPEKPYTGSMGLPVLLSYRRTEDGALKLLTTPYPTYESKKKRIVRTDLLPDAEGSPASFRLDVEREMAAEVRLFTESTETDGRMLPSFQLGFFGFEASYDADGDVLFVSGIRPEDEELISLKEERAWYRKEAPSERRITGLGKPRELRFFIDGSVLEIFVNGNEKMISWERDRDSLSGEILLSARDRLAMEINEVNACG